MKKSTFIMGMLSGIVAMGLVWAIVYGISVFQSPNEEKVDIGQSLENILQGATQVSKPEGIDGFEEKVNQIDEVIDKMYYESVDQDKLWESAYEGYVSGLGDPYSSYFTKEQFDSFMEDTSGTYEGIGVVVSYGENGEDIEVVSPYADSPGEKAGILPGDRMLKVNNIDITGMTLEEVVKEIKGPKGTEVVINVYRKSTDEILDIKIIRDVISEQTVSHEMLENGIGYIRLSGFEEVTYDQFMTAFNDLESQGQKGLILDLRNNPGGLVEIVSKIGDELLPEGLIVYTEDKNGLRREIKSDAEHVFDKPLVVLVNGYSASASEILSGAIKDHERGTIIGTTTFGKGLVQGTYALEDGSAIKVTIARYYTPDGNDINHIGIVPDIEVQLPEEYQNYYTVEREFDTQLQKAMEVISNQIQ